MILVRSVIKMIKYLYILLISFILFSCKDYNTGSEPGRLTLIRRLHNQTEIELRVVVASEEEPSNEATYIIKPDKVKTVWAKLKLYKPILKIYENSSDRLIFTGNIFMIDSASREETPPEILEKDEKTTAKGSEKEYYTFFSNKYL